MKLNVTSVGILYRNALCGLFVSLEHEMYFARFAIGELISR